MPALLDAPPLPHEPDFDQELEALLRRPKSFLVCSWGGPGTTWQIASWTTDHAEAQRRAEQLVEPPHLETAACVVPIGGSVRWTPIFFPEPVVTRQGETA